MKTFYKTILSYFGCLFCIISLTTTAQVILKAPQQNFELKTTTVVEPSQQANLKVATNQTALDYASLKKEQHFDIYYPAYDSLENSTQGIFWRIHQDFRPEEYIPFPAPDGSIDSLNLKFKSAMVSFNWLNDSFNEDSVTVAFEDAEAITIDTIFYFYAHANRSGTTNILRTRIMPVNTATGQPVLSAMPLWEDVFETDTSLTAPNNNPDSLFLDLRVLPVNLALTENQPFAVVVDFDGGNKINDEFNLLATYNQPCGADAVAQLSKFYANSYYEFSALIGGVANEELFPAEDLGGIGFDFDNDMIIGEDEECENFYIQNWHIGATVTFNTSLKAQIIAAADTICKNDAVDLRGKGLFGEEPYTYSWAPTEGLTQSTAASTAASPSTTTTYTLTVKDATEAEHKMEYTIYVNDLSINLGADVEVECGTPYQAVPEVTNSFGKEVSFLWNHKETTAMPLLTAGNYQLTIEDGNCEATDDIVIGLLNTDLIVDFNADNIYNAVVEFENTSENSNFYAWDFGDGNNSSVKSPKHTYLSGGTFQVSLNASSGNCSSTKYATILVGTASSVYNMAQVKEITVGPNPVENEIHFSIQPTFLKSDFEVQIYSIQGKLIQKQAYTKNNVQARISVAELPSGIYFVSFKIDSAFYQQKIIVIP